MKNGGNGHALPERVGFLAQRLVQGWEPTTPRLGEASELRWGDESIVGNEASIEGEALNVELGQAALKLWLDNQESRAPRALRGRLSGGLTLVAEEAHISLSSIAARYWHLQTPGRHAELWVARISGFETSPPVGYGNLFLGPQSDSVGERTGPTWGHYCLKGAYQYVLVKRNDREWFLVFESAGTPDREALYRDWLALQFVFGRGLYFDTMYGVEAEAVCEVIGGRHGRDHHHRPRCQPPVPVNFVNECWVASFFERISLAWRAQPEQRFYVPLTLYLDSLITYNVQGRYLVLHVALEAFAYWISESLPRTTEEPLVDSAKWRAWLAKNKEELAALAAPGKKELLLSRIASAGTSKASSRIVENMLAHYNVQLTKEMRAELGGRNHIVHAARMLDERQVTLAPHHRAIAVVRTMLVALVARTVGYRGSIFGWTRDANGRSQEPPSEWWPHDSEAATEAMRQFIFEPDAPGESHD